MAFSRDNRVPKIIISKIPTLRPFAKRETKYTTRNSGEKRRASGGRSFVAATMPSKTEALDPRRYQGKPRTEFSLTPTSTHSGIRKTQTILKIQGSSKSSMGGERRRRRSRKRRREHGLEIRERR